MDGIHGCHIDGQRDIYYFSLVAHLPPALRHQGFLLDWGSDGLCGLRRGPSADSIRVEDMSFGASRAIRFMVGLRGPF